MGQNILSTHLYNNISILKSNNLIKDYKFIEILEHNVKSCDCIIKIIMVKIAQENALVTCGFAAQERKILIS